MIFIEFNGLPGSGKTTIVERLIAELKKEGVRTISLEEIIFFRKSSFDTKFRQLIGALFCPSCFRLNYNTFNLIIESGISMERIKYAMRLIKLNYQIKRVINTESFDLLLLDEGFVQFVTSIPHNKTFIKEISVSKVCRYIMDTYSDIQIINCILPIEMTISRSKNRKSSISRFDNLNPTELERQLGIKSHNIEVMRKLIPKKCQLEVNLSEDIDKNVNWLKDYILYVCNHPTKRK